MTQAHTVISDDSIRKSAKEIFETSEFRQEETAYLFQKWLNKMGDLLNSFQDWTAAHPAYTWLLIAGLMIILILLIAHIVYSAFGDSLGGATETSRPYKADRSLEVLEGKTEQLQRNEPGEKCATRHDATKNQESYQWSANCSLLAPALKPAQWDLP